MATHKDVIEAVIDLDVKVKIVKDPSALMSITKDGVITLGEQFMEKLSPTELKFAIQHEYAHVHLDHFHRLGEGEQQINLEYEADRFAAEQMMKRGENVCEKLDNIESARPLWDTTHPSRSSLRSISCDASDNDDFVGSDSKE